MSPMTTDDQTEATFGAIAVEWGLASDAAVAECLSERERLLAGGTAKRLGELLIRKGVITKAQALKVLKETHRRLGSSKRIGNFELQEKLGEGAMGVIYKARQVGLDRIVALKLLPRALSRDATLTQRFLREARTVARFNHPNIICGYEVGEANGYQFFAMEFVDGGTLEERLAERGPFGHEEMLRTLIDVTRGLQHAHRAGIIHRDIKPSNIMIGAGNVMKLADLGLAASLDATQTANLTGTGNIVGTPYYMAPEQVDGKSTLDARTDIYALGATAWHLAAGQPPFDGESVIAIITRRLHEDAPDVRTRNPRIGRRLADIIRKMMAREPAERYQDCETLLRDLEAAQARPGTHILEKAAVLGETVMAAITRAATPAPIDRPSSRKALPPAQSSAAFTLRTVTAAFKPPVWLSFRHIMILAALSAVALVSVWAWRNQDRLRTSARPAGISESWNGPAVGVTAKARQIRTDWVETRRRFLELRGDPVAAVALLDTFAKNYPDSAYAALALRLKETTAARIASASDAASADQGTAGNAASASSAATE